MGDREFKVEQSRAHTHTDTRNDLGIETATMVAERDSRTRFGTVHGPNG